MDGICSLDLRKINKYILDQIFYKAIGTGNLPKEISQVNAARTWHSGARRAGKLMMGQHSRTVTIAQRQVHPIRCPRSRTITTLIVKVIFQII